MKIFILLISLLLPIYTLADYQIYAQVSAKIIAIAKVNQIFKKDEVLVSLDDRIAKTSLTEQLAILSIKQQLANDAQLAYQQTQQLFDNLVRSKRELELAEIAYKQAQYELEAQSAKVLKQRFLLEQYKILAPFDLKVIKVLNPRNISNNYHSKPLLLVQILQQNNTNSKQ